MAESRNDCALCHRLRQATRCLVLYVGAPCIGRTDIAMLRYVTPSGALGYGRATCSVSVFRAIGEVSLIFSRMSASAIWTVIILVINEQSLVIHYALTSFQLFLPLLGVALTVQSASLASLV